MWKNVKFLVLLPLCLFAQALEVHLPTKSLQKEIYLSQVKTDPSFTDWRYADELRDVFSFDLNAGGLLKVASFSEGVEKKIESFLDTSRFALSEWRANKFPYLVLLEIKKGKLLTTVFDLKEERKKRYPEQTLSGSLKKDRAFIHYLSDQIHKDLLGAEGIASLKILYAHRDASSSFQERKSEICLIDYDGSNPKQLTFENNYCLSPSFFPHSNSSEICFASYKDSQSKLYRFSLKEGKTSPFLNLRGNQILPSISRSGRELAFIADIAGRPDLFLQKLDKKGNPIGKPRQLFTAPRATEASPTFSPDGQKIAFVSDKDGPARIYFLEISNAKEMKKPHPSLLTKKNRENTCPSWSPDGTKIAYSAKTEGIRQIWIYDFALDEEIQLTTGPQMKENPCWAPDSFHLIYNTESEESCELFLMNTLDPNPVQITSGPGHKRFPCWEISSQK